MEKVLFQKVGRFKDGVKGGGAAFYAMDLIAFFEEEFGKVRAVLAGDAGD